MIITQIPCELLDEKCKRCPDQHIEVIVDEAIYAGDTIYSRDIRCACVNIELCKRLKEQIKEGKYYD